jgi:hypothetical protein
MVRQAEEEAVAKAKEARIIVLAGQQPAEVQHRMMGNIRIDGGESGERNGRVPEVGGVGCTSTVVGTAARKKKVRDATLRSEQFFFVGTGLVHR